MKKAANNGKSVLKNCGEENKKIATKKWLLKKEKCGKKTGKRGWQKTTEKGAKKHQKAQEMTGKRIKKSPKILDKKWLEEREKDYK